MCMYCILVFVYKIRREQGKNSPSTDTAPPTTSTTRYTRLYRWHAIQNSQSSMSNIEIEFQLYVCVFVCVG